jgi:hypothetical protein
MPAATGPGGGRVAAGGPEAGGLRKAEESIGGRVNRVIDVFAVADRRELERLTGLTYGGYADPLSATVVITGHGRVWRALHHEIMHVVSVQLWGVPAAPDGWLLEGLGTLAMEQCAGREFDALAAHLLAERRLPGLTALIEEFHSIDDVVSYIGVASAAGWIRDRHGRDAVRALWQQGVAGAIPGRTVAELESGWHGHLRTITPAAAEDFDRIREGGCHEPARGRQSAG